MGFSISKSLGNTLGKIGGAAIGGFFGGPAGAAAGYSGMNTVLGAVGLGDDDIALEKQKALSDYQFSNNLAMWNLQNAYNDPSAQMARLKAAGLNPNLVYGGGNVTGNTTSNYPTYEAPKYEDKSVQREQLSLALAEHHQRITNQAIENDLARQRLVLQEREANRNDALAQAQINAYKANLGMVDANIGNIEFKNRFERYKSDLDEWRRKYDIYYEQYRKGKLNYHDLFLKVGRRPMLMDYR